MTLLFIDGFDHYLYVRDKYEAPYTQNMATSTVLPRTGTRHLAMSTAAYTFKYITDSVTLIIGCGIFVLNNSVIDSFQEGLGIYYNGIRQLSWEFNTSRGHFRVKNTTISNEGTTDFDLTTGYHYVELKVTINDTTGSYELKVNGTTELSGVNVDTDPANSVLGNQVKFAGCANSYYTYTDDVYICDALGATNNDFLGSIEVHTLYPDADGNQNDFTPLGGGANYVEVDETPVDDNTSYVYSGTNGHLDLFDVDTLSGLDSILGVQVNTIAEKTEAAAASMQVGIRSGGANHWGSIIHLLGENVYANYEEIWEQDPNGPINWTTINLNNAEFGFKLTV